LGGVVPRPTPQAENMRYGGNTSCVEVRVGETAVHFDCGTGFAFWGNNCRTNLERRSSPCPLTSSFRTFTRDHIQGIPFFRPLYDRADSQFLFHCSSRTRSLKQVMDEQMASPYFPVNLSQMQAHRSFTTSIVAG